MSKEGVTVTEVEIDTILKDLRFQVRKKLDSGVIHSYAMRYKNGVELPPVKIALIEGMRVLVDGFHRVVAKESNGDSVIAAEIIEATEREALWMAAKANLYHGLPLKHSELREVFRKYIRAREHYDKKTKLLKSFRTITQELGGSVSHSTIRNWMQKDFPKIAKRYAPEERVIGSGGLRDVVLQGFLTEIERSLEYVKTASKSVTNPFDQGKLIGQVELLLQTWKSEWRYEREDF